MITFALYDSKDIQLAKIIYKLSPQRVKILALDFEKKISINISIKENI